MPLYLGIDCSTQSLTAVVIEVDGGTRRVVFNSSLNFDRDFPGYGTSGGVVRGANPDEVFASPLMWADALDRMMARIARSAELDLDNLRAIAGSAQQHGSVYLNHRADAKLGALKPAAPLAPQLRPALARELSPVWMDASTSAECRDIERILGGPQAMAALTGSQACERFTGPQIRKFHQQQPDAYADTARIHLVSSFLATLLAGSEAPIDTGDGSGMNLMDIAAKRWSFDALRATAPNLAERLPPIRNSWEMAGQLSQYWRKRYSLPPAWIVLWTGDNPSSLIGTGVVREGMLAVSLGTSDTTFTCTRRRARASSHGFRAPTGDYMNLVCFRNGSLTRERVRDQYGLDWNGVASILDHSPGNGGRIMLPWLEAEITPLVMHSGVRRFGFDRHDRDANVRGLIEGQLMAIANHGAKVTPVAIDQIIATGGAAVNPAILQVMANVFNADVFRLDVANSAALGAALRAYHAERLAEGEDVPWSEVVAGFTDPNPAFRVSPNPRHASMYAELRKDYAFLERLHQDRFPIC